jgi:hypothetical protein
MCPLSVGAAAGLAAAAGGYATLYRLGQTWGATDHEQQQPLAGDELLPEATALTTHAITIAAPRPTRCGHGWRTSGPLVGVTQVATPSSLAAVVWSHHNPLGAPPGC